MLPSILPVYETWQFDDRSTPLEYAPRESCGGHVLSRIRTIPRLKDQELWVICPPGSAFFDILHIQQEPPLRIGNGLANRIVFGDRVKRIDAVSPPEGHHNRANQRSLGLGVHDLPPVWRPRSI